MWTAPGRGGCRRICTRPEASSGTPYGAQEFFLNQDERLPVDVVHAEHVWWFPEEEGPDFGCFRSNANLLFGHEHFDPDSGAEPLKCLLCRVEVCAPPPEKSKEHGERKFVMFLTSVSASRPCPAFTAPLLCAVVPCRIGGALRLMLSLMVCTATPTRSNISTLRESPACRKPAAFPYPARDSPRAPFSGTRQKLYARTVVRNPLHRRRSKLNTLLKPDARGTTRAALRLRASPSTLRSIFPFPRERQ